MSLSFHLLLPVRACVRAYCREKGNINRHERSAAQRRRGEREREGEGERGVLVGWLGGLEKRRQEAARSSTVKKEDEGERRRRRGREERSIESC